MSILYNNSTKHANGSELADRYKELICAEDTDEPHVTMSRRDPMMELLQSQMREMESRFNRYVVSTNNQIQELREQIESMMPTKGISGFPANMDTIHKMYVQIWHKIPDPEKKNAGHTPWSLTIEAWTDDSKKYRTDISVRGFKELLGVMKRNKIQTPYSLSANALSGFPRRSDGQGAGRGYCGEEYATLTGQDGDIRDVEVSLYVGKFRKTFSGFNPTKQADGASIMWTSWRRPTLVD